MLGCGMDIMRSKQASKWDASMWGLGVQVGMQGDVHGVQEGGHGMLRAKVRGGDGDDFWGGRYRRLGPDSAWWSNHKAICTPLLQRSEKITGNGVFFCRIEKGLGKESRKAKL